MLLRMLSACAPCIGCWINPTAIIRDRIRTHLTKQLQPPLPNPHSQTPKLLAKPRREAPAKHKTKIDKSKPQAQQPRTRHMEGACSDPSNFLGSATHFCCSVDRVDDSSREHAKPASAKIQQHPPQKHISANDCLSQNPRKQLPTSLSTYHTIIPCCSGDPS